MRREGEGERRRDEGLKPMQVVEEMGRDGQGEAMQNNDNILLCKCESLIIEACEGTVLGEYNFMTRSGRRRDRLGARSCFEGLSLRHQITKKFLLE